MDVFIKQLTLGLIIAILPLTATQANESACGAILCLAGDGGGACSSYLKKYFSIKKFDSDGDFSPRKTKSARGSFLNKCPGADPETTKALNNKYGTKYNGK